MLECPEAVDACESGDELEVDLSSGTVRNITRGITSTSKPYPEFMMSLINAGGLVAYTKGRLEGTRA